MIPRDPAEIEALAAEYVLGTLEGQRDEIQHLLEHGADPGSDEADIEAAVGLEMAVAWWERHLAGLSLALPPMPPPPEVWASIERRMATAPVAGSQPATPVLPARSTLLDSLAVWRAVAGAAIAACVALIVWSGMRTTAPVSAIALLTPQGTAVSAATGTFLLQREGERLRVTAVDAGPTPSGRDLELWSLKNGTPAPLGIVRSAAYLAAAPFAAPGIVPSGTTVAISLEPSGGSTSGQPTGPVLYVGTLTEVAQPS